MNKSNKRKKIRFFIQYSHSLFFIPNSLFFTAAVSLSIIKNIPLSQYTTFKIGGQAKFFVVAKTIKEIKQAVAWAKKNNTQLFILGGGSNLLVSDKGFDGLVIKIQNTECQISVNTSDKPTSSADRQNTKIIVGAGMPLAQLVAISIQNNLTGLEWAVGIPGTVGGAARGNAGAFGGEMAKVVKNVKTINDKLQITNYKLRNLKFNYRDSIFKSTKNKDVIFEVELELEKDSRRGSAELIKKYSKIKKESQPLEYPSAGSVFKNYRLNKKDKKLPREFPEMRNIIKNDILPVGWLIEQCGLKGKRIGGAMISEKHSNFIVNIGGASADDVMKLIRTIRGDVRKKFGIQLEEEIQIIET